MASENLISKVLASGEKKVELFKINPSHYYVRAFFAGMYLTFGTAIAATVGDKVDHVFDGLGKIVFSILFGLGLVMIVYMNAELATSNMMYMAASAVSKRILWLKALKLILVCVLFNFFGAVITSYLFSHTAIFAHLDENHLLYVAVDGKLAKDWLTVLIEAVIANVIVNTAVVSSLKIKDDIGKIFVLISIVFIFVFLGFEHVIANFASFSLALFTSATPLPNMLPSSVVINFVFALIGNIIGGGLVIGAVYAWFGKGSSKYID